MPVPYYQSLMTEVAAAGLGTMRREKRKRVIERGTPPLRKVTLTGLDQP